MSNEDLDLGRPPQGQRAEREELGPPQGRFATFVGTVSLAVPPHDRFARARCANLSDADLRDANLRIVAVLALLLRSEVEPSRASLVPRCDQ